MKLRSTSRKALTILFMALLAALPLAAMDEPDAVRNTTMDSDSSGGILVDPTLIGTVLEVADESFLLDTTVGKQYIVKTPRTEYLTSLQEGEKVAVDFHRTTHGVRVAAVVREPMTDDQKTWKMVEKDYEMARSGEYQAVSTSFTDGVHQVKAGPGKHMGHTMIGQIVEINGDNDEQIVVETSTGTEAVMITKRTKKKAPIQTGALVAVDFTRTAHDVPIATQIREAGEASAR